MAAIVLSLQSTGIRTHLGVLPGLLSNPLSVAIATAVLIFLVVERWRNLETEINKLRDDQQTFLRDIRSDSEDLVKSKMEQVTNRAQAIEGRISELVDKHPWVTDISEMEIIPDSPLCRVVLATAEELLVTKAPLLCFEYLSAILREDSRMSLEGIAADFLDLASFCEVGLSDGYLAYRAIAKGVDCSTAAAELIPYYLRLAVRYGDYRVAARFARYISRQENAGKSVKELIIRHIDADGIIGRLPIFALERNRKRNSDGSALASLALFEAAYGRKRTALKLIQRASDSVTSLEDRTLFKVAEIETLLFLGERAKAEEGARGVVADEGLSSPLLGEICDMLRQVGFNDPATSVNNMIHARVTRRVLDSKADIEKNNKERPRNPNGDGKAASRRVSNPANTRSASRKRKAPESERGTSVASPDVPDVPSPPGTS